VSAFTISGSRELKARLKALGDGKPMMRRVAVASVESAKALVPRRTANLARSIRVERVTATSLEISAGGRREVGYAAHVEFGTRAHVIRPRNKKTLFFPSQQATTARFGAKARLKFNLSGALSAGSTKRFGNAAYVHARAVNHPGTRAQPYLVPGLEYGVGKIATEAIIDAWNAGA